MVCFCLFFFCGFSKRLVTFGLNSMMQCVELIRSSYKNDGF